ncbi:MAG: periplasmic heavy metal sensor [Balneola sp.]|nr:periplasmic heavy metal sensor [Balneola sp.]MBO6650019.1 periplasmic heavy metal sensor [Balneola sp.]MBO6711631.1 periplasmic heavy metal sensor [Balneola sp.]MBO6799827.1 periplasmic heavy metal sensor [Balneola sp.]MBO6870732.1 periplasmic heavy metal sensor [Balneola sp.]
MRQIITSTFLLLLIGTVTVQAQRSDQQERRKVIKERVEKRDGLQGQMRRGPQTMLAKLDLSEDQKEKIKGIMLEGKQESLPLENQLREKRARLRTLSSGDTYDVAALNKVVDEMSALQASIKKIHIAKKGEIRALLNDEQKIKFDTMPDRAQKMRRQALVRKRH